MKLIFTSNSLKFNSYSIISLIFCDPVAVLHFLLSILIVFHLFLFTISLFINDALAPVSISAVNTT
ncbi:hypothetical protein A0H76_2673 [Hepatospora eriocheir]|uniref:Uncharacterized protein n=1 Tax=Hepatospora eriocheir TaxID=1081669 RepID=A0A1X0QF49_9MICR|nr:hypothetical protein A0H76_2673 [Hepatospora eriocheir]